MLFAQVQEGGVEGKTWAIEVPGFVSTFRAAEAALVPHLAGNRTVV